MEGDRSQPNDLRQRLAKAQQLVRSRVPPSVSLADELIAERREEARRELSER